MNYVGGKYKLLPQLVPLFPPIETFVDLFCGGLTVSLNVKAVHYRANDICSPLIGLYQLLQQNDKSKTFAQIDRLITLYGISETNQDGYLALRKQYNADSDPLKLMVLLSHSFNHQLRFNQKNEFNMPFGGKRCHYTRQMRANLSNLIDFLQSIDISFSQTDFRQIELNGGEFIYCDPPYQQSVAVYNRGWGEQEDRDLLMLLDEASKKQCKFALSCVLLHKGVENKIIKDWSQQYHVHNMKWLYGNCNYHQKDRKPGVEACITNYLP